MAEELSRSALRGANASRVLFAGYIPTGPSRGTQIGLFSPYKPLQIAAIALSDAADTGLHRWL